MLITHLGGKAENLEGMGPMGSNKVWHIVPWFLNDAITLANSGRFKLSNGTVGYLRMLRNPTLRMRVHWVPLHVHNSCVLGWLERDLGIRVKAIDFAYHPKYNTLKTTTRLITYSNEKRVAIPDFAQASLGAVSQRVLISINGRPPLCLRCGQRGHVRATCKAAKCTNCHQFGHLAEACQQVESQKTWAQKAAGPVPVAKQLSKSGSPKKVAPKKASTKETKQGDNKMIIAVPKEQGTVVDEEGFMLPKKRVKRKVAKHNGLGKGPSDGSDSQIESGAEQNLVEKSSKGKGPGLSKQERKKCKREVLQSQSQGEIDCKDMEVFAREVETFLNATGDNEWDMSEDMITKCVAERIALMEGSRKTPYHKAPDELSGKGETLKPHGRSLDRGLN